MQKETFNVENSKVSSDKTIALISDMHLDSKFNKEYYSALLDMLDSINPNYITLCGDYFGRGSARVGFDDDTSRRHILKYLYAFREIAPVIMSLGNHDVRRFHDERKRDAFRSLEDKDIYPLDNANAVIDDVNFMGYMPTKWAYPADRIVRRKEKMILRDIEKTNFVIDENRMNILLSHLPNIIYDKYLMNNTKELYKYDLVLSGHHHGGLSKEHEKALNNILDRLEKIGVDKEKFKYAGLSMSPINPIPFLGFKTRGMHEINGTNLIIGRGARSGRKLDDNFVTEVKIKKR
jgi:predicted MPP superfamily phosphohydrolase